jgi:beta-galactosidase GanA
VFFCGYGHFGQVRKDVPLFPGYGVNIIQTEFGPNQVLPTESEIKLDGGLKDIADTLDNAAKNNIMVNVLLSPHYFPQWAYDKWPHIRKGGYFFCNDCPEGKYVMGLYLRTVALALKDKPALHSFCISNEPRLGYIAACDGVMEKWADYLTQTHGDVQILNARYGTSYKSMSEVPVPANHDYAAPQFYDWIIFNQQYLAEWHKWMADIIHEVAPNVPVHSKIMGLLALDHSAAAWAVDPEMFGQISEINGNDCATWPGGSGWGISWREMNVWYDLQRSLAYKPVFNSENHISGDGSTYYMPPENFRTALWQGAIHGQGATTI